MSWSEFDAELRANRELPNGVIDLIRTFPTNIVPMDALRTGFSALVRLRSGSSRLIGGGEPP
jgi:citrate synthase